MQHLQLIHDDIANAENQINKIITRNCPPLPNTTELNNIK